MNAGNQNPRKIMPGRSQSGAGLGGAVASSEAVAGLPFGIIDPDYARYYTLIRTTAWQCGYAIGLHGSFTRDLDLIAVPWTAQAIPPDLLIKQIEYRTDLRRQEPEGRQKPHGRMCWSLLLPGFTDPRWVDLSVIPLLASQPGCAVEGEAVAKAIYEQWADRPGYVAWVDGGNSLKQNEARVIARAAPQVNSTEMSEGDKGSRTDGKEAL